MKKQVYTIFYLLLSLLMINQVIQSIYQSSLIFGNNHQLEQLYTKQQSLITQKQKMQSQLALKVSLTKFSQSDILRDYQPINKIIIVNLSKNLAAAK